MMRSPSLSLFISLSFAVTAGATALGGAGCVSQNGLRPMDGGTPAAGGSGGGSSATGSGGSSSGNVVATSCSGGTVPLPASAGSLTADAKLPDPFMTVDGTRITQAAQWACRRNEIAAQAQQYELGPKPDKPASVTGAFSLDPTTNANDLTVTASDGTKTISFVATITYPTGGPTTAPYPAMIGIGGIALGPDQLSAMGVALINFPNDAVALQNDGGSRGMGVFYDLYGSSHRAGAMMAWAWGVSRLIDALETTPAANIDYKRLGVTGCSRNGKGALIAGAFDERIALTVPQESGSGGAASWRVSDYQVQTGTTVQTLSEITGENVWFTSSFSQFGSVATRLPFDHHMIEGLVAPRALLIIENTSQVWLGNISTYNNSMAAHLIWQGLQIPDHMGVSQIGDHSHCMWNGSQQAEVTAYVQKFLIGGGTADTNVLKTDGGFTFDMARWVDWDVPTLQ
jgi:hypothetical protein